MNNNSPTITTTDSPIARICNPCLQRFDIIRAKKIHFVYTDYKSPLSIENE